jgi:L-ascorbate metabolism protein UlaG (beta-lactamase superfamily)
MASLTWLGHAAFLIESDEGKKIYVDPFLNGNPQAPEEHKNPEHVDVIAVTHGHGDHVGDTVALSKKFPEAQIIAQVELKGWLGAQGAMVEGQLPGGNKGGTQEVDGIHFTLVNAFHSSSTDDGTYAGESCGLIVRLEGGRAIYFAGDTCVFGDMALIARLYAPDYAVLPIGDHFTMGPREAALALELLGNPPCIPCHYGAFPILSGTPEQLRAEAPDATVHALEPGGTLVL